MNNITITRYNAETIEKLLETELQTEIDYQRSNKVKDLERIYDYYSAYADIVKKLWKEQPLIIIELLDMFNKQIKELKGE